MTIAGAALAGGSRAEPTPIVEIATGRLQGATDTGITCFIGIPYAAAPIDSRRYRSPRPAEPWTGVRDATRPGAASIQTLLGAAAWLYDGADPQSEDCLYLNVWTPSTAGRRPVMVWFHGGAWRTGHGLVAGTNGTALAGRGDVVVVTVNYRLGVLGWLAHPALQDPATGAFANWGQQDQIAALRWVQQNIAAFGGDPGRVTIFGQSAGGQSVATIVQNPANTGLFHQAIIQSGSLHGAPGFPQIDTAAHYAEAVAKAVGTDVPGLFQVPARQLHETELRVARDPASVRALGRPPILPVLDGQILTAWPRDAGFPAIPLLIGTTRSEATFWYDLINPDGSAVPGLAAPRSDAELETMIRDLVAIYRPEAAALPPATIADAYRQASSDDASPKALWMEAYTDIVFRLRALQAAGRHAHAGHPAFLYEFQHPLAPPGRGVPHTAEIPFIFATYAHPFFSAKTGAGPAEADLSALMLTAWARFAHTGVPASPGTGPWTPVSLDGQHINLLGGPQGGYRVAEAVRTQQTSIWKV
jgi:para-nitrobenzyl esterase